jgi:hypothetical protein
LCLASSYMFYTIKNNNKKLPSNLTTNLILCF